MLPLRLSSLPVANKKSAATKILFALAVLTLVLRMGLGGRLTRPPFYCTCHAEQGEHFKLNPLLLIVLLFSRVCWFWSGLVWFGFACLLVFFFLSGRPRWHYCCSSFQLSYWKLEVYLISSQILLFLSPAFRMYAQHSGKGFVFNPYFQNYSPCMILWIFTYFLWKSTLSKLALETFESNQENLLPLAKFLF